MTELEQIILEKDRQKYMSILDDNISDIVNPVAFSFFGSDQKAYMKIFQDTASALMSDGYQVHDAWSLARKANPDGAQLFDELFAVIIPRLSATVISD